MSDSINRSAAIHAVCAFAIYRYEASQEELDAIRAVLNALPAVQPEPRRGTWRDWGGKIVTSGYCAICSACGEDSEYLTDFCHNCGADMREGSHETD